ncbi:hypothetical protein K1T71_014950, partial [Dendrolimus kikuchii]
YEEESKCSALIEVSQKERRLDRILERTHSVFALIVLFLKSRLLHLELTLTTVLGEKPGLIKSRSKHLEMILAFARRSMTCERPRRPGES